MDKLDKVWNKLKELKEVLFAKKEVEKAADDFSELELKPVKVFLEDFIGVIITSFVTFKEEVPDLENKIQGKMVVGIELKNKDIWVKLSKINGNHGGYLKISPTIFGQFSESANKEQPLVDSLYRIIFYGGVALEYTDFKGQGNITYHPGLSITG